MALLTQIRCSHSKKRKRHLPQFPKVCLTLWRPALFLLSFSFTSSFLLIVNRLKRPISSLATFSQASRFFSRVHSDDFSFSLHPFFELFLAAIPCCDKAFPHHLGATSHNHIHPDLLQNLSERGFLQPLTLYSFLPFPRRIFQNLLYLCPFESGILLHSIDNLLISRNFQQSPTMMLSFPRLLSIATNSTSACLAAPSARCGVADTN